MRTAQMIQNDIDAINRETEHLRESTKAHIARMTARIQANAAPVPLVMEITTPNGPYHNPVLEGFYKDPLAKTHTEYPFDVAIQG